MLFQQPLELTTTGRELINITGQVSKIVSLSLISSGLCNVFLHHTSASLILCENADPSVQVDLNNFMSHLVPDGDPHYEHIYEGPDDMPSHIRSILTQNSISIPIANNLLMLGAWQGIFLWEHRLKSHMRRLTITVIGE
ncbi:MAG: protein of unknown function UPF0047 [uncultured bacterium]|nr:MAG: protein of unknown function UPF0047 [uncultured bacterium]